eukprot:403365089
MTYTFDIEIHDSMLMAVQLSRHGARTGRGHDPFNVFQEEDEITNTGRRQHYLMGTQMRERYVNQAHLISSNYNASEITIKTTNDNETIESALSQMLGLYPPQYNKYNILDENQTSFALPQLNLSQSTLNSIQDSNALPFALSPISMQVSNTNYDNFLQGKTCEFVKNEMENIKNSQDVYNYLDGKHSQTIWNLAQAIYRDPTIFKAQDAVKYIDSLYAKYIDQQKITPGMTSQMVHDMMVLYYDYLNQTVIRNPTVLKALLTSSFNKIIYKFIKQIERDKGKNISKNDQHKLLIYIDHDDIILYYSNLLNHLLFHPMEVEYIPFASIIMLELHKFQDGKYYVNASINGEGVSLPGPCNDQYYCEFDDFQELARRNSYYDNSGGYERLCGISLENKYTSKISNWNESYKYATGILRKKVNPYLRVLELYTVLMLIIILAWIIYSNLKGRDQPVNPYHPVDRNNVEMT